MHVFNTVLFPTDLLSDRIEVADAAARIARRFESPIILLHVIEAETECLVPIAQETAPLQQLIEQLNDQGVVVAESAIVIGSVVESILQRALEINADLIVLGAGESSPPDRHVVGPVAQAVLELASQPVLVVRRGEPVPLFHKILCPVDHSNASRLALEQAIRMARDFDGDLVVLTVVPKVNWLYATLETGNLADAQSAHTRKWVEEFEHFLGEIDFAGVRWSWIVRHGVPDEEIRATVKQHDIDVLVMGATGRSGLARMMLGSVTRRVVLDLPCSLVTIKPDSVRSAAFVADSRALEIMMAQGEGFLQARSYDAAAGKFRTVLTHHPFHAPAMHGLATALKHLGHSDEANFYEWRARNLHAQK